MQLTQATVAFPTGTVGIMTDKQERFLVSSVEEYRHAISPRFRHSSVEKHIRNGEQILVNSLGGWYPMCDGVQVFETKTVNL